MLHTPIPVWIDMWLEGASLLFTSVPWLPLAWLVPLGAAMGSFLNCMADRIPRKVSLRHPPSYCDSCHTPLGWSELVPLLSWAIQKARCKHCGAPVPARNFWLEVFTTAIPPVLFLLLGSGWLFVFGTVCAWVITGIVMVKTQKVP